MSPGMKAERTEREVRIPTLGRQLSGTLSLPRDASGIVLFAHGSGSGRSSPRNQFVAESLRRAGLGTLLIDLLGDDEADGPTQGVRHRAAGGAAPGRGPLAGPRARGTRPPPGLLRRQHRRRGGPGRGGTPPGAGRGGRLPRRPARPGARRIAGRHRPHAADRRRPRRGRARAEPPGAGPADAARGSSSSSPGPPTSSPSRGPWRRSPASRSSGSSGTSAPIPSLPGDRSVATGERVPESDVDDPC